MMSQEQEPCYVISIAARMIGVHAQTLRYYERAGMIEPGRSQGNQRLYSERDIERLRRIKTLVDDMGINLAGVEIIFRLTERIEEMEGEIEELRTEIIRLAGNTPDLKGE
ncbi:MAG: MerR family transcriptional regulator [Dehalococcoidia bacterium]